MDEIDKRQVLRFMAAIEEGTASSADAYNMVENFDPLLAYFLLRYLREKYPVNVETSSGPNGRLLELLTTYPSIAKLANPPKNEPMVEWFDDSYAMRSFFPKLHDYVDLIIDKLEG